MTRMLRRTLQVFLVLATLAVGAAALAIVVSQTAWFKDWLRGAIVRQANQRLNGTLSIGRLGGNLFFGLEVADLGIERHGQRVLAVKNVGVDYSVLRFVAGDVAIDHIRLDRPQVVLRREAGKWNLADLVRRQGQGKEPNGFNHPVSIGELVISDGRVSVDRGTAPVGAAGEASATAMPASIDGLNARLSFSYEPGRYSADIASLSFRAQSPNLSVSALSGKVAVRDGTLRLDHVSIRTAESSVKVDGQVSHYLDRPDVELQASADKLSMGEVGRFVPALAGIPLQPSFRTSVKGPLDRAAFDFAVQSSAGDASGQVTADLVGPDRGIAGTVHVANLDLAPVTKTPAAQSRITGVADIRLRFPSGPGAGPVVGSFSATGAEATVAGYSARNIVAAGRVEPHNLVTLTHATASAYGGRASAAGTIQPGVSGPEGKGVALDLRGSVSGLDLRNLPRQLRVPPLDSRLSFDYRLSGVGAQLTGDATLQKSTLLGATLGARTTVSLSNAGPEFQYRAAGTVEGLDLRRVGQAFDVESMTTDRFASRLNGPFTAAGRGATLDTLALDAKGTLTDSSFAAVRVPQMDVEAHIAAGGGQFKADGAFVDLDPGKAADDERWRGTLGGRLNAEVRLASLEDITPATVSGSGTLSLSPSSIGDLAIQRAEVEGEYSASTARVAKLDVAGPDVALTGHGTLALGTAGTSDFAYHVESPKLTMIATIVGQPIVGAATVDGKVTGNGEALRTTGTLEGSDVGYRDNRALSVAGRYDVTIPNFDAARALADLDLQATLLSVGGRRINQLQVKSTYASQQLHFDAVARSMPREAHVVGTLLLHTGRQEVRLTQFALRTQGLEWTLAQNHAPVIGYGGGRIEVKGLRLVSGEQAIGVEGVLDPKASDLRAAVTDVDLARLDTWLVGEHRLGGVLNAAAHITGPSASPLVAGDFSVDRGAFRDFRYERLGGTVNYTGGRVSLDVRLSQSPQAWMGAKGTLPTALWSSPSGAPDASNAAADSPIDLEIDSSPIDLGLVQGFTGAITKASGTLEAHVKVAGTAGDPQMSGGVGIANGAFTVPSNGVAYSALNGRIDLEPGRAVFNGMSLKDEHGNSLSVTGDVRVHQKELGTLALSVNSRNFEVLHNDLGQVVVDSDVKVGGQVRAPKIEGAVTVQKAQINLDKVLELSTSSAYSTKPLDTLETQGPTAMPASPAMSGGRAEAAAQPSGPYDAAQFDVHVRMPPDFRVAGKNLRPGGGPIGVGDVNVTVGGDVRLAKKPGGQLELLGEVTTVRGTYTFQGRRFDIQRDGRVRFEGANAADPALDVTATRLISGVEARVHVGGTAQRPQLTLTSRPPLDEADILALIIFNQPANQLGEGDQASLAQQASALATGFVASKLANSIGRALNLDTFEIQTVPENTGGQGAQVTIGQQLGQRLFVKLTQGVGTENLSEFQLEYQFNDFLRFQTTMTQGASATRSLVRRGDRSGVDLIFFFSY